MAHQKRIIPFLLVWLSIAFFLSGCRKEKATQVAPAATATAELHLVIPAPSERPDTAIPESTPTALAEAETNAVESIPTDVVNIVINTEEAPLYSGPGSDYDQLATVFGGLNYQVLGASQDGLWWRLLCYDDNGVPIEQCWISADPAISLPTDPPPMQIGSQIQPYIELTFNFLRAIQSGLTADGSEQYLSRDLQTAVEEGRPLPDLLGIREPFPSFVMSDLTRSDAEGRAQVRVRINYDDPTFVIINLIQEDGQWRISSTAPHNLVQTFSTGELLKAEEVISAYFNALADDRKEDALALLTPDAQDDDDLETLTFDTKGLKKLVVATMQPVRANEDQINYIVRLLAQPDTSQATVQDTIWRAGDNARWLTMTRTDEGWRIARITGSAILDEIVTWQRVNVTPINMTLDVPADWTQPGLEWTWSPNSLGIPSMGVNWAELDEYEGNETFLPRDRRDLMSRPVDLGWASGVQFTSEIPGGPGDRRGASETHIIVETGRRVYDFFATATTAEELDDMGPILQQMIAAVTITDPQANAFNSVETTVNFLATVLRDGTGATSLIYLDPALRQRAASQEDILALLGVDTLYRSFDATWQRNPVIGQAHVAVSLNFDEFSKALLFTVERDTEGKWTIIDIKPAGN